MGILMWGHMEGTSDWCFTCGWNSLGLQVAEVSLYDMTHTGPGTPDFTSQTSGNVPHNPTIANEQETTPIGSSFS